MNDDEEKNMCDNIEKMLNNLENKIDWVIDIRKLIENINKENKNVIMERMFKLEDIFREMCQILNKTLFYIKRNQSDKQYKENDVLNPNIILKSKIKDEEIKKDINMNNIDNKNKDIKSKKEFFEDKNEINNREKIITESSKNLEEKNNEKKNIINKNPLNFLIINDNNNLKDENQIINNQNEIKKDIKSNIPSLKNTQLNFSYNHSKKELDEIYGINKLKTIENDNYKNNNEIYGINKLKTIENDNYKNNNEIYGINKLKTIENDKYKNNNEIISPIKQERNLLSLNFNKENNTISNHIILNEKNEPEKISTIQNEDEITELQENSLNNLILFSNNDRTDSSINPIEIAEQIKNREDKVYQLTSILKQREDLREMLSQYYERDIIELLNSPELDTDIIESMFTTIEEIEKLKLRDNEIYEEENEDSNSI